MSRKVEAIDLMKLFSQGSNNGWNEFLTKCADDMNIEKLCRVKYSLQAGMDDLAKKNLNTAEMNVWFIRLCKSIDQTARLIIRKRHPLPQDNPLVAKDKEFLKYAEIKTKRDRELAAYLKKSSY